MIHYLNVNDDNIIDYNDIDLLSSIDLSKSIFISTLKNIITYDADSFIISHNFGIDYKSELNGFEFFPWIKISTPKNILPLFSSNLIELYFSQNSERKEGFIFNKVFKLKDDSLKLSGYGEYIIYDKFKFYLRIDDKRIIKQLKSMQLPSFKPLIRLNFIPQISNSNPKIKDIYVINSKYIYNSFPNFGSTEG